MHFGFKSAGNLMDLKKQRHHAFEKAQSITDATTGREWTEAECAEYDLAQVAIRSLNSRIEAIERKNTLQAALPRGGVVIADNGRRYTKEPNVTLSSAYEDDFFNYISSNGQNMGAALYEGSNPAGGYAVPITVEGQVVPLAPTDMGVREIANVLPTAMDIKIPRATSISTATAKAEGTGNGSNLFTESDPALDQFTLSAFMAGLTHTISWELAQDVPAFQSFALADMLLAQSLFEENWFVNGTGTGQPQGLIGNTGAGITGVLAETDTYTSELLDATFDVMGTLKTAYHPNASWLMARATSIVLRKAQKQANLFEPVFTLSNGKDYLHGYPVTYSTAMPAIAAAATPILFGDFKQGYVIGERGGAGVNIKILDQPRATEGMVILLAYRRLDGRVRRSEAIQAITLHS